MAELASSSIISIELCMRESATPTHLLTNGADKWDWILNQVYEITLAGLPAENARRSAP